jgi:hypothetical protein
MKTMTSESTMTDRKTTSTPIGEVRKALQSQSEQPQHGLWAPGDYLRHCLKCGDAFIGDKRAGHCAKCAYGN